MKNTIHWLSAVLLATTCLHVHAATALDQPKSPPVKAPTKAKPVVGDLEKLPMKAAKKKSAMPDLIDPIELTTDQLAIAEKVYTGEINCDLATKVTLTADVPTPGRFLLQMGSDQYLMTPVVTSSGAVRLENAWSGAVWIQVANKSMLIDRRAGVRLADGCAHPDQLIAAQKLSLSAGLID